MELHQIFLDMAVLVEAQGEMLDNIEAQVGDQRLPSRWGNKGSRVKRIGRDAGQHRGAGGGW